MLFVVGFLMIMFAFCVFFYFKSVSAIDLSAGRGFILKSLVIANHVTEI